MATLKEWIDSGANWPTRGTTAALPWSFAPVRHPAEPVINDSWKRNAIDSFILARLQSKTIRPSREAEHRTLLRRVYMDLIGLPPTPEQVDSFIADMRPDAYERVVDELLASPHYGEKWARHWLDLARYADSEGGVQDYARPFAWRYREWVINAFNQDMPFNRFTVEQIAGDLLPKANVSQKIATGFHRNTITSREGGVDLDRIRFEQLVDRTSTIGAVWLGLTVGCSQCHDHKFDPIAQKDFYSLMAFFENVAELDLEAPLPGEWGIYRQYAKDFRLQRDKLLSDYKIADALASWENGLRDALANPGKRPNWDVSYDSYSKSVDHGRRILLKRPSERSDREQDGLVDHFVKSSSGGIGKEKYEALKLKELGEKLKALEDKYPRLSTAMTVAEESERSPTHVRIRGVWSEKGDAVLPGTPGSLPPLKDGTDRLALAKWLVSRDNPLTARVTVNRLWQELFGRGLVRTTEDFGAQGEKPTYPELLDWLASEFVERGWSMKRVVRLIVTSATYRQASDSRPDLNTIDPANTLLARQSRFRLPAELIRDSALQVSGLLNDSIGGPSVKPPQPEGVAELQYKMNWEETKDRTKYRRGLYIFVQRTALYPLLMNFDAPDRTVSCARRDISNTPLQALNLMNDPIFVEAAQSLAWRILQEAPANRIDYAFQLCFARLPSARERDLILSYQDHGQSQEAKWFGLSRALLNSDEFLTRE
ncbi:MAG TPA: DUF1549 and DUF1553 domain-containing protein [Bryobacteraceae bacterium]|nr:DUF1549 and DUF1553 domain-containing protein [Bryobacteraceae bacterium]